MAFQGALPGLGEGYYQSSVPGPNAYQALPSRTLSQMQFNVSPAGIKDGGTDWQFHQHLNEAQAVHRPTGQETAYMEWTNQPKEGEPGGEIKYIETDPAWRRQGIASRMFEFANGQAQQQMRPPQMPGQQSMLKMRPVERMVPPVHSPMRTDAGEAWSQKVGGYRPERNDWRPDYSY